MIAQTITVLALILIGLMTFIAGLLSTPVRIERQTRIVWIVFMLLYALQIALLVVLLITQTRWPQIPRVLIAVMLPAMAVVALKLCQHKGYRLSLRTALHGLPVLIMLALLSAKAQAGWAIDVLIIAVQLGYGGFLLLMARYQPAAMVWRKTTALFSSYFIFCALLDTWIVFEMMQTSSLSASVGLMSAMILACGFWLFCLYLTVSKKAQVERLFEQNKDLAHRIKQRITPVSLDTQSLTNLAARAQDLMLKTHYYRDETCNLSNMANRLSVPPRHLSMAINQVYHKPFTTWVNDHKIDCAKNLLASSDMNITNVMFESGFQSKSSFHKEFTRRCAGSPSLYRQELSTQKSSDSSG